MSTYIPLSIRDTQYLTASIVIPYPNVHTFTYNQYAFSNRSYYYLQSIENTNFTTYYLHNIFIFIIYDSNTFRPYILAIFRELHVWFTCTVHMATCHR
jgi:hypothetical protein